MNGCNGSLFPAVFASVHLGADHLKRQGALDKNHFAIGPVGNALFRQRTTLRDVIDSVENDMNSAWMYADGKMERAVQMQVMKQPGANTIEVADAVKALFPAFKAQLPPSVSLTTRGDRSSSIRASFRDIETTMGVTGVLVVIVIFVFLRSGRATLIPALALPFSILGTVAVMKLLGFSLNTLSMMALILSICFVVDDAIVMLENIVRHIEMGEDHVTASHTGTDEIGLAVAATTFSIVARTPVFSCIHTPTTIPAGSVARR